MNGALNRECNSYPYLIVQFLKFKRDIYYMKNVKKEIYVKKIIFKFEGAYNNWVYMNFLRH